MISDLDSHPVLAFSACAIRNAAPKSESDLNYRMGDTIAIIALDEAGNPALGVIWQEDRRIPGQYQLQSGRMSSKPLTPITDWLDDKTPIFYFSKHLEILFPKLQIPINSTLL